MNTLYQATRNISESSWFYATTSTKYGIRNVLDCAGKCQIRHSVDGNCNAFKYDNSSDLCDMGLVTFLEDPGPGETAVAIMVDTEVIDSLGRVCRGGESCCGPEATRTCGEGEGDCQGDWDCEGTLQCGEDNCAQSGGLWDAGDDCCERRCSSDRPCPQVSLRMSRGADTVFRPGARVSLTRSVLTPLAASQCAGPSAWTGHSSPCLSSPRPRRSTASPLLTSAADAGVTPRHPAVTAR